MQRLTGKRDPIRRAAYEGLWTPRLRRIL